MSLLSSFWSASIFFLVESDEERKIGKSAKLGGLGNIVFAALQLVFCVYKANVITVFYGGHSCIFLEKPSEIDLAHTTKLRIVRYRLTHLPILGNLKESRLEIFVFIRYF